MMHSYALPNSRTILSELEHKKIKLFSVVNFKNWGYGEIYPSIEKKNVLETFSVYVDVFFWMGD